MTLKNKVASSQHVAQKAAT